MKITTGRWRTRRHTRPPKDARVDSDARRARSSRSSRDRETPSRPRERFHDFNTYRELSMRPRHLKRDVRVAFSHHVSIGEGQKITPGTSGWKTNKCQTAPPGDDVSTVCDSGNGIKTSSRTARDFVLGGGDRRDRCLGERRSGANVSPGGSARPRGQSERARLWRRPKTSASRGRDRPRPARSHARRGVEFARRHCAERLLRLARVIALKSDASRSPARALPGREWGIRPPPRPRARPEWRAIPRRRVPRAPPPSSPPASPPNPAGRPVAASPIPKQRKKATYTFGLYKKAKIALGLKKPARPDPGALGAAPALGNHDRTGTPRVSVDAPSLVGRVFGSPTPSQGARVRAPHPRDGRSVVYHRRRRAMARPSGAFPRPGRTRGAVHGDFAEDASRSASPPPRGRASSGSVRRCSRSSRPGSRITP